MEALSRKGSNFGVFCLSLTWICNVCCTPSPSSFLIWVASLSMANWEFEDDALGFVSCEISHCKTLAFLSIISWTSTSFSEIAFIQESCSSPDFLTVLAYWSRCHWVSNKTAKKASAVQASLSFSYSYKGSNSRHSKW